jgi:hypothetical protein
MSFNAFYVVPNEDNWSILWTYLAMAPGVLMSDFLDVRSTSMTSSVFVKSYTFIDLLLKHDGRDGELYVDLKNVYVSHYAVSSHVIMMHNSINSTPIVRSNDLWQHCHRLHYQTDDVLCKTYAKNLVISVCLTSLLRNLKLGDPTIIDWRCCFHVRITII